MNLPADPFCPPPSAAGGESSGIRLQVYLAHAGVASRRTSGAVILDGRVQVNGRPVTDKGFRVTPADTVCVDGKPVFPEQAKRYVLLNKPAGVVSTNADEQGRRTAVSLLAGAYRERLYNIGRLDMYSEGALLFTNDGGFARQISHPSSGIEKEYLAVTFRPCDPGLAPAFQQGIEIDGTFYQARRVLQLSARCLNIILIEGKNREIRRVFDFFGARIKKLQRIRIGCVRLGDLPSGAFRDLTAEEIDGLRRECERQS